MHTKFYTEASLDVPLLFCMLNLNIQVETDHNIKWDHFKVLANGRSDLHCKINETLFIRGLKSTLNENDGSEKLWLYFY